MGILSTTSTKRETDVCVYLVPFNKLPIDAQERVINNEVEMGNDWSITDPAKRKGKYSPLVTDTRWTVVFV